MSVGERLDLSPSHLAFARVLAEQLTALGIDDHDRPVVAIAGESGSGKSITATALARVLTDAGRSTVVLHQDDYFFRPPRANHEHRCRDIASVGTQEVDLALLAAHVAAFRAGRDATGPRVDYPSDSFATHPLGFASAAALIVEGTYVLHLDDVDIGIFLEATYEDTAHRRRQRNRDIDAPIVDRVLAIEHQLIAPQATRAHVVITREFAIKR